MALTWCFAGVLERLADLLTLLFGEREFVLVELDVLASFAISPSGRL